MVQKYQKEKTAYALAQKNEKILRKHSQKKPSGRKNID